MRAQNKKSDERINEVKFMVKDLLKEEIASMLKAQIDEQIAQEIRLQTSDQVSNQIGQHLPGNFQYPRR
jgi:hypothetical protein